MAKTIYSRSLRKDFIRVLDLEPGSNDDPIVGNLRGVSMVEDIKSNIRQGATLYEKLVDLLCLAS
jgi:hypothetical protein